MFWGNRLSSAWRQAYVCNLKILQLAHKIMSVYMRVCACACAGAAFSSFHPHDRSPSKRHPQDDFLPVLKSILPTLSQYLLHIITPLVQPASSYCKRIITGLHCAALCVASQYYYLLITVVQSCS